MKFIAITGSIGCGKTTISNILRKQGFLVYDIDKWVKYLYYKKEFLEVIKKFFPECFENGVFNKRKLRNIVFDNPCKLKQLEGLIHPFLTRKLKHIIRRNKDEGCVFVDVALLFEMGWDKYFDYVVLAYTDEETQKLRVMKRDNISAEDFYKINKLQMSGEEKIKKADFVIETGCDEQKLCRAVFDVLGELL
ncbi:MAG: dephospho-CoA kinase [Alphaproteobacteria bacterium]|nr:dephospho-CoA kinase [Alphaproteobacteria bacterium]